MKRISLIALMGVCVSCFAEGSREFGPDDARKLLGSSISQLQKRSEFSLQRHMDFVDEDETVIHTQKWSLVYRWGGQLILWTDDGIATRLEIRDDSLHADRGVRVGDTLAEVKAAYPEAEFKSGSRTILSGYLGLFANSGNIMFTFVDKELYHDLRRGKSFHMDDERISGIRLASISFQDGNQYACEEQFPCPLYPDRYGRK